MEANLAIKRHDWVHGNKGKIETGHKTFDRQCRIVSTGQMLSSCQVSLSVRSYYDIESNGMSFPVGHLFNFDMQYWRDIHTPQGVQDGIRRLADQYGSVMVFTFHHYYRPTIHPTWSRCYRSGEESERLTHGWVAVKNDSLLHAWIRNEGKSPDVMEWCMRHICIWETADDKVTYFNRYGWFM